MNLIAPGMDGSVFSTLSQLQAASIPANALALHYVGGGALRTCVRAAQATSGSFQTADGSYWVTVSDADFGNRGNAIDGFLLDRYMSPYLTKEAIKYGNFGRQIFGPLATTSGNEIVVPNLPDWANEIIIQLQDVSASGAGNISLQVGDEDQWHTTGYLTRVEGQSPTDGFRFYGTSSGDVRFQELALKRLPTEGSLFSYQGFGGGSSANNAHGIISGRTPEMKVMTRIRLLTPQTTQTFDLGRFWVECRA